MLLDVPIQSFRFGKKGLNHIFGQLEARLIKAVWDLDQATVQGVIDHLGGELNYKTTMTVLNRLTDKGVLQRHKSGRAFTYSATASQDDLLATVFDRMVRDMFEDDFRDIALAQMIETAEALDPQLLDDISQLIRQRKADAQKP